MWKIFFPILTATLLLTSCSSHELDCVEASTCSALRDKLGALSYDIEDSAVSTARFSLEKGVQLQEFSKTIDVPSRRELAQKSGSGLNRLAMTVPAARQEIGKWQFDPDIIWPVAREFREKYLP